MRTARGLVAVLLAAGLIACVVAVSYRTAKHLDTPNAINSSAQAKFDSSMFSVSILGDSVAYMSTDLFKKTLGPGKVEVVGAPGYRTEQLLQFGTKMFASKVRPDVGILISGHNDIWQDRLNVLAIAGAAQLLGGLGCGVILLIPESGGWLSARARQFNESAVAKANEANVHTEPAWRDAVDAGPGSAPDPKLISPDGVHPTGDGQKLMAKILKESIDRNCRS